MTTKNIAGWSAAVAGLLLGACDTEDIDEDNCVPFLTCGLVEEEPPPSDSSYPGCFPFITCPLEDEEPAPSALFTTDDVSELLAVEPQRASELLRGAGHTQRPADARWALSQADLVELEDRAWAGPDQNSSDSDAAR